MLSVKNLSISFGENVVLKDFSFNLAFSESLGIVGESGSGKSVTALSLMGLLPPSASIISGEAILTIPNTPPVNLLKINSNTLRNLRGKSLAMIFQEPLTSLNPSMKCGKQVLEAVMLHQKVSRKVAVDKCLSLLKEMQLPDPDKVYKSYPHQLSGGQKQRVMIAMALAGNPSILIADEPTTALDVTVQKEIIILLKQIKQNRGMSLIFISHDLGVISEITDNVLVLKDGVLVEEGTTSTTLTNPSHAYTKGLIACRPPLNERPVKLQTVQDFLINAKVKQHPLPIIETLDWDNANKLIYAQAPILKVKDVDVEYVLKRNIFGKPTQTFSAVKSLSFDLFPGETLGLVGESGCGKTTLGRAIMGLVDYKSGSIIYKGSQVNKMSSKDMKLFRREVQFVFQDPFSSLNPRHTVGETIMEPIKFHGLSKGNSIKERALHLLEQVSLPHDSFYRYPHEFSGGQRQRVVIARALALEPKVIVCDEMVSALDVSVQAQILNLLNQLKANFGLTFIFISHDLSVVKYMSNRMMVMKDGECVEYGNSDQVYSNSKNEYTQKLINAIPGVSRN